MQQLPDGLSLGPDMQLYAVAGGVVLLVLLLLLLRRRRSSAGRRRSRAAHEAAQGREPPVDVGDVCEFGITEFTDHHSGATVAVGKVEGFVVFTENVPGKLSEGDVIRAKITSFNRGRTSADARFVGSR